MVSSDKNMNNQIISMALKKNKTCLFSSYLLKLPNDPEDSPNIPHITKHDCWKPSILPSVNDDMSILTIACQLKLIHAFSSTLDTCTHPTIVHNLVFYS